MPSLKIKRGTRAQIVSAAGASGLVQGEPYLITDENRLAVGLTATTYQDFAKASEGKYELVSTVNASAASSVAFTGLASTYSHYILVSQNLYQSTVTNLKMQCSTDNGSTWDTAAKYASQGNRMNGSLLYFGQNSQTSFDIAEYITNSGSGKNFLRMEIYGANDATCHFKALSRAGYSNVVATNGRMADMQHTRADLTAVNAIKLYPASGTITGEFLLYGVRK